MLFVCLVSLFVRLVVCGFVFAFACLGCVCWFVELFACLFVCVCLCVLALFVLFVPLFALRLDVCSCVRLFVWLFADSRFLNCLV